MGAPSTARSLESSLAARPRSPAERSASKQKMVSCALARAGSHAAAASSRPVRGVAASSASASRAVPARGVRARSMAALARSNRCSRPLVSASKASSTGGWAEPILARSMSRSRSSSIPASSRPRRAPARTACAIAASQLAGHASSTWPYALRARSARVAGDRSRAESMASPYTSASPGGAPARVAALQSIRSASRALPEAMAAAAVSKSSASLRHGAASIAATPETRAVPVDPTAGALVGSRAPSSLQASISIVSSSFAVPTRATSRSVPGVTEMRANRVASPSPSSNGRRTTSVPAARSAAGPCARSATPIVCARSMVTSTTTSRTPGRKLSADSSSAQPRPRTVTGCKPVPNASAAS